MTIVAAASAIPRNAPSRPWFAVPGSPPRDHAAERQARLHDVACSEPHITEDHVATARARACQAHPSCPSPRHLRCRGRACRAQTRSRRFRPRVAPSRRKALQTGDSVPKISVPLRRKAAVRRAPPQPSGSGAWSRLRSPGTATTICPAPMPLSRPSRIATGGALPPAAAMRSSRCIVQTDVRCILAAIAVERVAAGEPRKADPHVTNRKQAEAAEILWYGPGEEPAFLHRLEILDGKAAFGGHAGRPVLRSPPRAPRRAPRTGGPPRSRGSALRT